MNARLRVAQMSDFKMFIRQETFIEHPPRAEHRIKCFIPILQMG